MKALFLTLITLAILTSSCKKEENETADDVYQRNIKLLSEKPWKPALVDKNPATIPVQNLIRYFAYQSCELDDTYKFNNDGLSLIKSEGALSCDNNAENKGVNYSLDVSKQIITIDAQVYQLAELTESQLKFYRVVSAAGGVTTMVYMYEH